MLGPIDFTQYLIAALVFVQLEMILPLRPLQKRFRAHWSNDVVWMLVNGMIVQLGLVATAAVVVTGVHLWVPAGVGAAVRSQPVWLQAAEVIVLADIGFYAAHRAFHAVPWLWRFHAVHHGIEEMDWMVAYRVHPVDQVLTKTMSYLPVFALGFSDAAVIIFVMIYRWHSVLIHANCRLGLGRLGVLFATPQFHHWHHANEAAAWDKNFAGQLPWLDWLGGTLHLPGAMPARYGTDLPVPTRYDRQLIYPFRRP